MSDDEQHNQQFEQVSYPPYFFIDQLISSI